MTSPGAGSTPESCQTLRQEYNKPLWTSEGWDLGQVDDVDGASNLAMSVNRNYILQNQTAMVVWTVLYAWYSILPFAHPVAGMVGGMGHGLMSATEPWSRHYSVQPPLYAVAHTTQFTHPGCRYLRSSAVGMSGFVDATKRASVVAFLCDGNDITIVVESSGLTQPQNVTLQLSGIPALLSLPPLSPSGSLQQQRMLHMWTSDFYAGAGAASWFQNLESVPLRQAIALTLAPRSVLTLTTIATGARVPAHNVHPSAPFPFPYKDDFNGYGDQATVHYFADEGGSFNAAPVPPTLQRQPSPGLQRQPSPGLFSPPGMALKQVVTTRPIPGNWWPNSEPFSLVGNSQNWSNYTVSVLAAIDGPPAPSPPLPPPSPPPPPRIVSLTSGRCLDVMGAKTTPGTPVFTYPCNTGSNQQWLAPAVGMTGPLVSEGMCATALAPGDGGASSGGTAAVWPVTIEPCGKDVRAEAGSDAASGQAWVVAWPTVRLAGTKRCLGLRGTSPAYPGDLLTVALPCNSSDPGQMWREPKPPGINVLPAAAFLRVCGRIHTFAPNGEPPQGYCLIVDAGDRWYVTAGGPKSVNWQPRETPYIIANGTLAPGTIVEGKWVKLALQFRGSTILPEVNQQALPALTDATFTVGMAAIGCGWHQAFFDDFSIDI